jgi:hypothetical protein
MSATSGSIFNALFGSITCPSLASIGDALAGIVASCGGPASVLIIPAIPSLVSLMPLMGKEGGGMGDIMGSITDLFGGFGGK